MTYEVTESPQGLAKVVIYEEDEGQKRDVNLTWICKCKNIIKRGSQAKITVTYDRERLEIARCHSRKMQER